MNTQKIILTYTGKQNVYHAYFKPYLCTSNIELPKMYNAGWNSFQFIGGTPEFSGENMPLILKFETENYTFYECQIEVFRKDGTKCSGYYSRSIVKATNEIKDTFSFD